jgi:hypothetical protein
MMRFTLGVLLVLVAAERIFAQGLLPPVPPDNAPPPQAVPNPADVGRCPGPCDIPSNLFGPCVNCAPRVWGSADYLMWWIARGGTPPLVVTGPPTDPFPGALDQPHTQILFGNQGLSYGMFSGLRLNLGVWLDNENRWGVEASGFGLEHRSVNYSAQGNGQGQPFLAAPFVSALTGNDNVYFISQNFAGPLGALLTGGVSVESGTQLWNWEVNGVANLVRSPAWTVDFLGGFRQVSLREDLNYNTVAANLAAGGAASFLGTTLAPGYVVSTFDTFRTDNLFNGPQAGLRVDWHWDRFTVDLAGKLALGSMHEEVTIDGRTTTNAPLPVTQAVGGIYAQASNIGAYSRNVFAVAPEVGINLCVDLTPHIQARVGYNFLYISNVVRPGDQIDTMINTNRVPIDPFFGTAGGPNRPAFEMRSTGFWAQGINFGLEFKF